MRNCDRTSHTLKSTARTHIATYNQSGFAPAHRNLRPHIATRNLRSHIASHALVHTNLFQLVLCTDHNHRGNLKRFRGFIVKPKLLRAGFRIWYINPARLLCIHKSRSHNGTKTFFKSNYRTCAIITRSWFETALDYKPQIFWKNYHFLVHKLSVI